MFLLFKLLASYLCMPSEPFSWLRASYESLRLPWRGLHCVYVNWYKLKVGTFDKTFTILDSGQITVQFHTPATTFSYLVYEVSWTGFYGTTLVLICVSWRKSRSETCQKLKTQVSFDMVGWDITYNFIFLT